MLKFANTQSWTPWYSGQINLTVTCLCKADAGGIRDHCPAPHATAAQVGFIDAMAAAGFPMILICGGDVPSTMTALEGLATKYPGSIAGIEGPNEVNNFGFDGVGGPKATKAQQAAATAAAAAFQAALYAAVHASPILSGIPVVNWTDNPAPHDPSVCDIQNLHIYPHKVDRFDLFIAGRIAQARKDVPGKPIWATETGFNTPPPNALWTPAEAAANYIATMPILRSEGVELVAAFELFNQTGGWGLFQNDGTPNPAAAAFASA